MDKFKELFILLVIDVIHSQAKYNYQHLFSHFWKVTNTFWLLVCLFFVCVLIYGPTFNFGLLISARKRVSSPTDSTIREPADISEKR